jgi:hypothetical protein
VFERLRGQGAMSRWLKKMADTVHAGMDAAKDITHQVNLTQHACSL